MKLEPAIRLNVKRALGARLHPSAWAYLELHTKFVKALTG